MKHSILHIARVLAWFLVSLHSINLILKIVRNIGIDDGITNRNLMVIPYLLLWIGFDVLIAVQCGKLLKNNTSGN